MDELNLKFHSQQINSISSLLKKYEPQGYQSSISIIAPEFENVLIQYRDFLIVFCKYDIKTVVYIVDHMGISDELTKEKAN
jgi:hypothetical protein